MERIAQIRQLLKQDDVVYVITAHSQNEPNEPILLVLVVNLPVKDTKMGMRFEHTGKPRFVRDPQDPSSKRSGGAGISELQVAKSVRACRVWLRGLLINDLRQEKIRLDHPGGLGSLFVCLFVFCFSFFFFFFPDKHGVVIGRSKHVCMVGPPNMPSVQRRQSSRMQSRPKHLASTHRYMDCISHPRSTQPRTVIHFGASEEVQDPSRRHPGL